MGKIQTGVDKLVNLLHEKHKITIDEAAKILGVSKSVIQEWSEFLEEEGLLNVKYSLSKTYLEDRLLTKREFEQKEKQFETQRETFIRKVDTAVAQLDTQTVSFDKFRKEFEDMKKQLGTDLDTIQAELDELKQYEALKQEVTNDLHKQHAMFLRKQEETDSTLQREYKQYQEILHAISEQATKLSQQKASVHKTITSEQAVEKKLEAYAKLLDTLKQHVTTDSEELGVDENLLEKLQTKAEQYRSELIALNDERLKPLQALKNEHDAKIKQLETTILAKAAAISVSSKKPVTLGKAVKKKLEEFFGKKKEIEALLHTVETDKLGLAAELKELSQRAQAYQLGKTSVRLEELESKLATIEERKKALNQHMNKFMKILQ